MATAIRAAGGHRSGRCRALAIATGLLAAVAAAGQPSPNETWRRAESGAIVVYSSAPEAKTRELVEAIVELKGVLDWLDGSEAASVGEEAITLYAFGSTRAMKPYLRSPPGRDIVMMSESYIGSERVHVALNATAPPPEVLPWVHQAYIGYRLSRRHPHLPYWARLGLARFHSTFTVEGNGAVRLGLPDRDLLSRLRTHSWIPLPQLFQLDAASPALDHAETLGLVQGQCWLIAHLLMTGGGGESRAGSVYGALERGIPPEEAIRAAFGEGLDAFEKRLVTYARGRTMAYVTLRPELPRPQVTVGPADHQEVLFRLGRYLVETHDPVPVAFAEAHLQPLVDSESWRGDALAALAELRHRAGRKDEARRLFEQAMAAVPKEAMSFVVQARFLAEAGGATDLAARRAALERAVAIEPGFGEAWASLAEALDALGDDTAAASALERAVELLPDQPTLAFNLAVTKVRLGDVQAARDVVDRHLGASPRQDLARDALAEIQRAELVAASNRAIESGDVNEAVGRYREAIAAATEPGSRARMEAELAQLERQAERQRQIELFNRAVAAYNARDLEGARLLIDELLAQGPEAAIEARARDLLAELERPR